MEAEVGSSQVEVSSEADQDVNKTPGEAAGTVTCSTRRSVPTLTSTIGPTPVPTSTVLF